MTASSPAIETRLVCPCGFKVTGDPLVVESLGFDHAERCETVKQAGRMYPPLTRWTPEAQANRDAMRAAEQASIAKLNPEDFIHVKQADEEHE